MSSLVFELGVSSVDAVEVMPHTSFKNRDKIIRSDFRSADGTLFTYKWGDYKQLDFKAEFVPNSSAMLINSWWNSQSELLFFVSSGSGVPDQVIDYSEVFSDYTWSAATRGVTSEDYIKIIESVTSGFHYMYEYFNGLVPDSDLYFDIKLKKAEKDIINIGISDGVIIPYMTVNLSSGTYTYTNSDKVFYVDLSSESDDFYRATIGLRYSGITSAQIIVLLMSSDSIQAYDGDGTSGVWAGDATFKGEVIQTEVHSVMLRNKYSPFDRFQKPYVDKYKGRIILETY